MLRRARLLWSLWVLTVVAIAPASAQNAAELKSAPLSVESASVQAAAARDRVQELLREGRQLESGEQWGDALSLYEDALRDFPNDRSLRERHDQSRIQFDVARRYHDESFRRAVTTLTRSDALAVYNDVLLKIESHYVHSPDYAQLVDHGLSTFDAALAKDSFVEVNLRGVGRDAIDTFRADVRRTVKARAARNRFETREVVAEVADLGAKQLGLSASATILEFTCGAAASLDHYSTYLTADQLRDVFSQIEGNFVGLGIEIKSVDDALLLVHVIPGSPAATAGLRMGERIVSVDGHTTKGVSTDGAASLLQGAEGSVCSLTIAAADGESREVRVRRANVDVPSVENAKVLDPATGVAYLKLACFQKTTARDLDTALWQLHNAGMKSLIVDLRGNPGGLLTAAVEIADRFVASGTIVSTRGRSPQEDFNYTAHRVGTWQVPLVVLIDGDSASASEIFAAAIQDNHRGAIVGRRSYGKGSVQGIFPLNLAGLGDSGGIRLTTAKFFAPSGRAISDAGVTPEVVVQRTAKPVAETGKIPTEGDDADLQAGIQVARRQVASR
ncbi:MAG: S41 family peptidase [Pirellulales bacterium]